MIYSLTIIYLINVNCFTWSFNSFSCYLAENLFNYENFDTQYAYVSLSDGVAKFHRIFFRVIKSSSVDDDALSVTSAGEVVAVAVDNASATRADGS